MVDTGAAMEAAVARHTPELIVCPILKTIIPESIWSQAPLPDRAPGPGRRPRAVVAGLGDRARHGGVGRDRPAGHRRGRRRRRLGHAHVPHARGRQEQPVPPRGPPRRDRARCWTPWPASTTRASRRAGSTTPTRRVSGRPRPLIRQAERAIDWTVGRRPTTIVRRIRAAEGHPGRARHGRGRRVPPLRRAPRAGPARRGRARSSPPATARSAARPSTAPSGSPTSSARDHFKLPATRALALAGASSTCPRSACPSTPRSPTATRWREISYTEHAGVGYLRFDFYNGAMSTEQCRRLLDAYRYARSRRQTSVIVLEGGDDFFSNGIHLNVIEAARGAGRGVLVEPARDRRRRARGAGDRLAPGDLGARRRRRRGRRAVRAGGRPRGRARGRRAQPVLPAHGRPVRLRVLDLPAAAARRRRAGRRADVGAVPRDRHAARGRDRADRRGLRRRRGELPRRRSRGLAERLARHPDHAPLAARRSAARGRATSRSSRSASTAPRSSRARTSASSGPTAATTRRARRFVYKPARRAPWSPPPSRTRSRFCGPRRPTRRNGA